MHRFPTERKAVSRAGARKDAQRARASFHLGVTPAVLRQRYNMTGGDVGLLPNNSQACAQVSAAPSEACVPGQSKGLVMVWGSWDSWVSLSGCWEHLVWHRPVLGNFLCQDQNVTLFFREETTCPSVSHSFSSSTSTKLTWLSSCSSLAAALPTAHRWTGWWGTRAVAKLGWRPAWM